MGELIDKIKGNANEAAGKLKQVPTTRTCVMRAPGRS